MSASSVREQHDSQPEETISQSHALEVFRNVLRSKAMVLQGGLTEANIESFRCVAKWPAPGLRFKPNVWVAVVHVENKDRVVLYDEKEGEEVGAEELRRFRKDISSVFVLFGQLAEHIEP